MITHSIVVFSPPKPQAPRKIKMRGSKCKVDVGGLEHKREIFLRASAECKWQLGDFVKFKGQEYEVVFLDEDFDRCNWDGLSPLLVGIYGDNQTFEYVHHNRLKRVK